MTCERKCVEICFSSICVNPQQPWTEYSWAPSFLDALLFSLFPREMKGKKRQTFAFNFPNLIVWSSSLPVVLSLRSPLFFFFFHEKCWKFFSCDMVTRCILIFLVHCVNCSLLLILVSPLLIFGWKLFISIILVSTDRGPYLYRGPIYL